MASHQHITVWCRLQREPTLAEIKLLLRTAKWTTLNCIFLSHMNTSFSTITELIKLWKQQIEVCSNHFNSGNRIYKHDLIILQQECEACFTPVCEQFHATKSQLTQCTKYVDKTCIRRLKLHTKIPIQCSVWDTQFPQILVTKQSTVNFHLTHVLTALLISSGRT